MPSFPAPGLGALVAVSPAPWLEVRGAAFEAAPVVGRVVSDRTFEDGAFVTAGAVVRHGLAASGPSAGAHILGAWVRTGPDSARGVYGMADVHVRLAPGVEGDARSIQVFGRFGWSPDAPGGVEHYAGGGVTLHGRLGRADDTLGLGGGIARLPPGTETFLELFYKLRLAPWLTFEPDIQLFLQPGGSNDAALVAGVRGKIKL
jgi:hypothetical protein